jgi:peptidylprolyl isomerase
MSSPTTRSRVTRVVAALLALGFVGGTALAACGSDGGSSSTDTTSADGATTTTVVETSSLDEVTVEGEVGAKPTITFDPSYAGDGESVKVVSTGTGPVVEADQLVTFEYVTVSGIDGTETDSSYGTGSKPTVLLSTQQILPIVPQALVGQPVGSRVLAATDQAGEVAGVWTVFFFEITAASTPLSGPSGEPVAPPAGLPAVSDVDGTPTITMPGSEAPTALVVQPLVKGNGAVVEAGQTIVANYVGAVWASGTVFDSSFERGAPVAFLIGQQQVIVGWDEGLVGQTVGSRMLLVIPPDKGYGSTGNPDAGISGTDTLVFIVDILAAG